MKIHLLCATLAILSCNQAQADGIPISWVGIQKAIRSEERRVGKEC